MVRVLATVVNLGGWGWALSTLVPLALLSLPGWATARSTVAGARRCRRRQRVAGHGGRRARPARWAGGRCRCLPVAALVRPAAQRRSARGVGGRRDRRVCGLRSPRSSSATGKGERCRSAAGALAAPRGAGRGVPPRPSKPFSARSPSCSASSRSCWSRPRSPWRSCVTSWSTSGSWCPARCCTSLLTGVVVAGYLGLVAILDQTVRGTSLGSSVLATVLVALAVNPVRVWLQRLVHRAFYGARRIPSGRSPRSAPGSRRSGPTGPGPRRRPRGAVPGPAAARRRHRDGRPDRRGPRHAARGPARRDRFPASASWSSACARAIGGWAPTTSGSSTSWPRR